MEELDLLKKDWNRERPNRQFSEDDIYKMLHRKSSSLVKWILIISILEVLLWAGISVLFSTDDYLKSLGHEEFLVYFRILTYVTYAVILGFIVLFYKNYKNITTTSSTKKLMKDILRTRKTVQYYVWYNLIIAVFSFVTGFILAISYKPEFEQLKEKMLNEGKYMALGIGIMIFTIAIALGLLWLFYRLLYGILLRRLLANYKELQKIDL